MYFKVIKDNKVIDVLDCLIYLKWEPKHKIMVLTSEDDAQAILASDKETIWHEETLYNIPVEAGDYDTISIQEVSKYEYKQLKTLNMQTPQAIIDEYNLLLLEMGII